MGGEGVALGLICFKNALFVGLGVSCCFLVFQSRFIVVLFAFHLCFISVSDRFQIAAIMKHFQVKHTLAPFFVAVKCLIIKETVVSGNFFVKTGTGIAISRRV